MNFACLEDNHAGNGNPGVVLGHLMHIVHRAFNVQRPGRTQKTESSGKKKLFPCSTSWLGIEPTLVVEHHPCFRLHLCYSWSRYIFLSSIGVSQDNSAKPPLDTS